MKLKEESIGNRRRFTQCDLSTFATSKLALKARTPLQIQARTIIIVSTMSEISRIFLSLVTNHFISNA